MEFSDIMPRDFIFHREALQKNRLKGVKLPMINLSRFDLSEFDFEGGDLSYVEYI